MLREKVVVPKVEVASDDGTQRATWNLAELMVGKSPRRRIWRK
jgi:hypothetical protein